MTAWQEVELGEVCEFKYGKSLAASHRDGGAFPVYGSNGIVGAHSTTLSNGPTIVIGRKGSFGEVAYSDGPCWPIDTTYYVDSTATKADLRWLAYRLNALGLTGLNRAAAVPGLNREDAYRQRLLVPSLTEQRRIATILEHADALRAQRRQVRARLDALTQSILSTFFSAAPVTVEPLAQAAEKVVVGHVGPTTEHFRPLGVPFLRTGNVGRGAIIEKDLAHVTPDFHQLLKKSQLRRGDVLVSRVISGEVRSAILPDHLEGANCANIIIVRPSDRISPEVVQGFLSLPSTQRRLLGRRVGSAQGVVNTRVLKELQTPIYSPFEQAQLRHVLQSVNWERAAIIAAQTSDEELFASLQSRAFRGDV